MDYEITWAKTSDDLAEVADLMAKVFASRSYFDFYRMRTDYQTRDPFYKPEFSRIIRSGGRIVSHVSIVEKHLRVGRAVVKVAGIGDVCTHPEHRSRGYTRILMEDAVRYMTSHRFPLSLLYGIMNFYHKFGYIEAVNAYKTVVPLKNLAKLGSADSRVRPYKESDLNTLNALYNKAFDGKTLSAERVEAAWSLFVSPKTSFVVPDKKDRPVAYLITSAAPYEPTLAFHMREAVAFDAESAAILAEFARDRARELFLPEVEIHQRPDSYFVEYLSEFGAVQTAKIYGEGEGQGMLRIVLLRELFEDIRAELSDRYRAWSNTPHGVQVVFKTDAGEVTLTAERDAIAISETAGKGATVLKTPQNVLTRLVIGYWGVDRFFRRAGIRRIPDDVLRLLSILFPAGTPYLNESDYF